MTNRRAHSSAQKKPRRIEGKTHYPFEIDAADSRKQGKHALKWLLHPLDITEFFNTIFEKTPKIVHDSSDKFTSLISLAQVRDLVTQEKLSYGTDLDVTRYLPEYGRSTHNGPTGHKVGKEAWHGFETGASLRLLRPQVHVEGIYRLCAYLESFVECVVGANVYITPEHSQGFAPHFDDIDAFVCQVSGFKRWRVYAPRKDGLDKLPRRSSVDFDRKDVDGTPAVIDTVLAPGDMLYLPRGAIHEARTLESDATKENGGVAGTSVHVTVSMFQKWTWADLLAESVALAVHSAACEDVQLRRTLPLCFSRFAGAGCTGRNEEKREWFHTKAQSMLRRVVQHFPSDTAADLLAARFTRERLPPVLNPVRQITDQTSTSVREQSIVRAVCDGAARLVVDADGETAGLPRIVTFVRNRRDRCQANGNKESDENADGEQQSEDDFEEHEKEIEEADDALEGGSLTETSCLPEEGQAIHYILKKYPKAVMVRDIPFDKGPRVAAELVQGLVEMGVLEVIRW